MKKRWLVLILLLGFLPSLLLEVPAGLLYGWIQAGSSSSSSSAVQLYGVHGTLSDGGAAVVSVRGKPVLQDLHWTLHPAWLALLRLTVDLETGGDAALRATLSRAPFSATRFSNVSVTGPVKALLALLGQPGLPVDGQVRIELPLLKLKDGVPVSVEGSADLDSLAWTLAREPLVLGSFNALLDSDDKGVHATLGSGAGPLELGGTATIDPMRAYDVNLQLRPRAEAAPALQTLVRSLGAPDAQGWYHLRRNGTY